MKHAISVNNNIHKRAIMIRVPKTSNAGYKIRPKSGVFKRQSDECSVRSPWWIKFLTWYEYNPSSVFASRPIDKFTSGSAWRNGTCMARSTMQIIETRM